MLVSAVQQNELNCLYFYLAVLGLSCSIWDLVLCPGIKPRPPALGAQSLSHWTTREVPTLSRKHIRPIPSEGHSTTYLTRKYSSMVKVIQKQGKSPGLPWWPVVKTLCFRCRGRGSSICWRGTKILHVSWPKNVNKQKLRNIWETVMAKRYLRSHDS